MKPTMNNLKSTMTRTRTILCAAGLAAGLSLVETQARPFRPGMYPNGTVIGCAGCHINPAGGGPRTPFGNDVYAIVKGPSATPFWGAGLAKKDSDGDGFTNGQEVGDPEGTGKGFAGAQVANPGVATSQPVRRAPQVAITAPVTGLTAETPYSGLVQASAKANAGTIVKVEILNGADLLGTLTSTPYELSFSLAHPGQYTLTARATDYLGASAVSDPVSLTLKEAVVEPPLSFTGITSLEDAVTISWTGGTGPYLLQRKSNPADTNWFNLLTTTATYVTVPKDGEAGVYRILNKAAAVVIPLAVRLEGEYEIPGQPGGGKGLGSLSLEGTQLSYHIHFNSLSGEALQAHLHGPADALHSAGVLFPLAGATSTSGVLAGTVPLTDSQLAAIVSGQTYVNIHTAPSPAGEIRGQVVPLRVPVQLSGSAQIPAVAEAGAGAGWITLVGNLMYYDIDFYGLSSDATDAHLHGPATATQAAGVLAPLAGASGTAGTLESSQKISLEALTNLLQGLTYVNVHTTRHPGGEIRGQVAPWQFTVNLSGGAEIPPVSPAGTGSGTLTLSGSTLAYSIRYEGLTSAAAMAHIHGPADAAQSAGVLAPLEGAAGTAGTLSGSVTLTAEQISALMQGKTYVNIHTANHGSGEIRGQIRLTY